jgi:hypothetical protein
MAKEYSVRLVARNEGVRYRGPEGVYDFDVNRNGHEWTVFLPPAPEIRNQQYESLVIGRVSTALSKIWWFGIFPRRYAVRTEFRQHPLVRKV